MKFCTNCGSSLDDRAVFCTNCGTMLSQDSPSESTPAENAPRSPYPTSAPAGETTVLSECQMPAGETTVLSECQIPSYSNRPASAQQTTPRPASAPAYSAPAPRRAATATSAKKQPSPLPIKLLCIFLSFVFCVVLATASTLGIARGALAPEKLEDTLSSVKLDDVEKLTVKDGDKEIPVSKYILDFCDKEVREKYDLDEDKVMKVLKKTKANEFVGDVLGDYAAYFVEGEELRELDSDRVINWIRENEREIENVIEYEFTEDDYKELRTQLDDSEVMKSLSVEQLENSSGAGISVAGNVRNGMSVVAYIAIIVLAAALALLITLINRRKLRALFTYVTVSLTVVGGFFLLLTGALYVAFGMLLPSLASTLLSGFIAAMLLRGGIMFGVGLIASVIHKLVFDSKFKSVS